MLENSNSRLSKRSNCQNTTYHKQYIKHLVPEGLSTKWINKTNLWANPFSSKSTTIKAIANLKLQDCKRHEDLRWNPYVGEISQEREREREALITNEVYNKTSPKPSESITLVELILKPNPR